jgi:hypothetical protein
MYCRISGFFLFPVFIGNAGIFIYNIFSGKVNIEPIPREHSVTPLEEKEKIIYIAMRYL